MLIVVVAIFALLWLPHRGMLVFNTVAALNESPLYMDLWFLMFAKTCIYINRLLLQYFISITHLLWGYTSKYSINGWMFSCLDLIL